MTTPEPGERRPAGTLDRPPSDRYARDATPGSRRGRPVALAVLAAGATAVALAVVGGVLAMTGGLLFVAGIGGAATGLLLAGRAVPGPDGSATSRAAVSRGAVALAVGAVVAGAILTWLIARAQGGVLDPFAFLWETTGLLVPAEALVASLAAAWGAAAGPVRGA